MSNEVSSTGRNLRQPSEDSAATIERVLDSAIRVLARTGFDGLNLRAVAKEAGSATATVYTYFESREQLVAEIVWRAMSLPSVEPLHAPASDVPTGSPSTPLTVSRMGNAATTLADKPGLAELRDRLADQVRARVLTALGPDADPAVADLLQRQYINALAGAGAAYAARLSSVNDSDRVQC
ncbi:TetR family transcriptional regulator [Nocardia sp. SYP-A9097]|uniref:TetR family transcriptional regulator n=1 Tax=Nocardia sp. SYP-A9097 TaxID=2663237 RepID=UPI001890BC97|nr:TetR family transcriptional regulator [Nocardia sp. SYP-A9097]